MDFLAAIIFALIGLGVTLCLVAVLIRAILPMLSETKIDFSLGGIKSRIALFRGSKEISQVDALIESEDYIGALRVIERGFVPIDVESSRSTVQIYKSHNEALLSRLLTIAEKKNRKVADISLLEDLVEERSRLIGLYMDSATLRDRIHKKNQESGRAQNSWNNDEFGKQLDGLRDDISNNKAELLHQLKAIVQALNSEEKSSQITYH